MQSGFWKWGRRESSLSAVSAAFGYRDCEARIFHPARRRKEGCYASMNLSFTRGENAGKKMSGRIFAVSPMRSASAVRIWYFRSRPTRQMCALYRSSSGNGDHTTACVAGCGRSRDGCSGDLSCDILCRLCAAFFRARSGEKGDRAE